VKNTEATGRRAGKKGSMKALRVLVVEDHADMRTGLKILFQFLGCRARFAVDLASAREAAREEHFDVLLSDINLPDGSGWDLLRELTERGHRPAAAVAMSGFGSGKDISESQVAGFDVHLIKPFAPEQLMAILERSADALPPQKDVQRPRIRPKRKLGHVPSDGGPAPMVYFFL
jgi:two-component system CheB/CheR fusion protein